ncbi:MAG: hypothetical protein A2722_02790 [Candidatus Doudnabacteria bacterium RIFCSPHIGHO2_01_FULL_50_11]|uniref:Uncharacterized protein n=1 Tax=Candidatus Doudnabacteria bacterium RIFCSPHIGHO2_01_FULL_50_11 TaxID=1817828 RepID=A0A1F5PHC8_9BACT|nr:MAG: hypothetical protein A2722_02790 [Candidatus Doudnabacteria bacterium RIFCSPHIGHO2_01_FULL_50_11]HLC44646.1 hypothetical protein [Patescibacteria group bacterium]
MLPAEIKIKYWKNSFYWSLAFLSGWLVYYRLWAGELTFGHFVQALEATAAVMIALSYAFGTITFYTNFLDHELIYRKWFGLMGYCYLVLYFLILIIGQPWEYFYKPLSGEYSVSFLLLSSILLYLSFMALIGHDAIIRELGPKLWRSLLRLGYAIYIFWIPRAAILYGSSWLAWQYGTPLSTLPPPSLLFTALSCGVVLFRLSVIPIKLLRKFFSIPPTSLKKSLPTSEQH